VGTGTLGGSLRGWPRDGSLPGPSSRRPRRSSSGVRESKRAVYLREKYQDEYAKQVVATERKNTERRKTADARLLPKQQEWLKSATVLHRCSRVASFRRRCRMRRRSANTARSAPKALYRSGPSTRGSAFDGVSRGSHQGCLGGMHRSGAAFSAPRGHSSQQARGPRLRFQAQKAAGGPVVPVDQITCEEISGAPLRIVVEVPAFLGIAKISVAGTGRHDRELRAGRTSWPRSEDRRALDGGDTWTLAGAVIEVSGVSRLARATTGALAFAMLKDRGMEMQFAIKSAENKNVWVANFDKACGDEGLGVPTATGAQAPAVKYISDSVSKIRSRSLQQVRTSHSSCRPRARGSGRWERAARAADPSIAQDPSSYHDEPWAAGFFPALVQSAQRPDSYGAPGIAVNLTRHRVRPIPCSRSSVQRLPMRAEWGHSHVTVQDNGRGNQLAPNTGRRTPP